MFLILGLFGGIADAVLPVAAVVGAGIGAMIVAMIILWYLSERFVEVKRCFNELGTGPLLYTALILGSAVMAGWIVFEQF